MLSVATDDRQSFDLIERLQIAEEETVDVTVTSMMIKVVRKDFLVDARTTDAIRIAKDTSGIVRSVLIAMAEAVALITEGAAPQALDLSKSDARARACLSYHLKVTSDYLLCDFV